MKLKEYRKKLEEMTDDELEVSHRNSIEELFHLRFQLATGHLEDTSKVRQLKKNLARIKTILFERRDGSFWKKRDLPERSSAPTRGVNSAEKNVKMRLNSERTDK